MISNVHELLYETYGKQLESLGFLPNKKRTDYLFTRKEKRKKIDFFKYRLIYTRKNTLHLNFSYTNLVLEDMYFQLELAIQETKDLEDFLRIKKKAPRPVIVITDWLHFLEKNQLNPSDYSQWLTRIDTDDDVKTIHTTYSTIFSLVQKNIVNKIFNYHDIYEYLLNKKHISCEDFQFILMIHSLIDKEITEVHQVMCSHYSYQNMNKTHKERLDLSYELIPKLFRS